MRVAESEIAELFLGGADASPVRNTALVCALTAAVLLSSCSGSEPDSNLNVSLTSEPDADAAAATFYAFVSADDVGFECSYDEAEWTACTSPALHVPSAPGAHAFAVRAIGADGSLGEPVSSAWNQPSVFDGHPDLIATQQSPAKADPRSWRGILRVNCDFAHSSYDDPIVFPGQEGAAHLHRFYGNTLTDHSSTMASLYLYGESTCQGNVLNRSAYWIPTLLAPAYDAAGSRMLDGAGEPAFEAVPAVVGNDDVAHEVIYYSAAVDDLQSIQAPPPGLRIIAGDASSGPDQPQPFSVARWHCQSWESSDALNPRWSSTIPECVAPDRLRMDVFFPSCWNGTDLDSADHKSHMAYPIVSSTGATECPASHPVPIARVSYHYAWGVKPEHFDPSTRSTRGWRLASDGHAVTADQPGGASLHGDWFNAWHPEVLQAIVDGCIAGGLDCHDGNLGNGYRLSGTRPGTQTAPSFVGG
ncbi:MAG: DUF1996 domain-containing protein [Acidimicrobiales bacterium]|nr:DUF1996 domain-containing protein [Acidimicrobiales bacterium]